MPPAPTPPISSRKQPRQARSNQLVESVLEAALQVLAQEGARRFTTARVAERAGVSVGSLYQYFPNKEAILFRLQTDEWARTTGVLFDLLADRAVPPFDRVRAVIRTFFRSECEEADMRIALDDAAPLYRDAPEARAHRQRSQEKLAAFVMEVAPDAAPAAQARAADMIRTCLSAMGKQVSEDGRSPEEVDASADAMADMLTAYLKGLAQKGPLTPAT